MTAALRRLQALEGTGKRRGVLVLPRPISVDAWEAIAIPQQQALMSISAEDRGEAAAQPKAEGSGGGLTDVSHHYKTRREHARPSPQGTKG